MVVFVAAAVPLGLGALILLGPLLAFGIGSDDEEPWRSVILTPRNLALAAAMLAALAGFWLLYFDLPEWGLVAIAGVVVALPLALQESAADGASEHTIAVTKRSLILGLWGLVMFAYLFQDRGLWFYGLASVCVVVPLSLVVSRTWAARRDWIELGLLRHPLRREVRPHLVQALNIWLCCGLLGGVVAAGGTHFAQIGFSLHAAQVDIMIAVFGAGLVLLAALAVVPRRRVYLATNMAVVLLSGFVGFQLVQASVSLTGAVVLDSPLTGEWFVLNGGRSVLLNGHAPNESNAVDFVRLGENGRTHRGGSGAPLADYAGFGESLLAPADGQIVEVTDRFPDNPPGTNSDHANHLVIDIGGGRYVLMAHLKQGSVTVQVGDDVRTGQPTRRGREQRSLVSAAPPFAGPELAGRSGRRAHLPHGVSQRPHHQGRCLALGRQPRASNRRPRPDPREMTVRRRTSVIIVISVVLIASAALVVYQTMDRGSVKGLYDIGGQSLYLECVGQGKPTIVMDAGSGGDHRTWEQVVPEVSGANQTCTYDRANIGASDRTPKPRSSADVVTDLHRLLEVAGVSAPYVLVGHSFGGISMRLYAATYPDAVVGVVLVDPTPHTFVTDACSIVDATACEAIRSDFEPTPNEGLDINLSAEALMAAGPLPTVPLVILVANHHRLEVITDPAVQKRFEEMWQRRQHELAASLTTGRVELVVSGHDIQALHHEVVVRAIRSVLDEVALPILSQASSTLTLRSPLAWSLS